MSAKTIIDLEKVSAATVKKRAQAMPIAELRAIKKELDERYETGETGLSDFRYDEIEKVLIKRDSINVDDEFGGDDDDEEKVKLPYFLGSMEKVKPKDTKKLENWMKKNQTGDGYMVSAKLDGISCLAVYAGGGEAPKVYTRGRKGTYGRDISWLVGKMPSIPTSLDDPLAVRGELVMPLDVYRKKYAKDYDNSRSIVQGLIGSYSKGVKDLHFVTYEILDDGVVPPPADQFEALEETGFEVVQHVFIDDPSVENLTEILLDYNIDPKYRIDGIIVQSNVPVKRTNKKFPPYAFAFKIDGEGADVEVIEVIWNVGTWKTLDPKIRYEETMIGGFKNEHATAHNARKIFDEGIGPGAIVHVIRSGDVIPYIWETKKPGKVSGMPTEFEWKWDEDHIGKDGIPKKIIGTGPEVERLACIKRLQSFFKKMEVNEFGPKRVEKMYDNGMDNLIKILGATPEQMIEGVESKAIGTKMHKNVRKLLTNPDIPEIVGASGVLGQGIGRKRAITLAENIPNIFEKGTTEDLGDLKTEIMAVPGFGDVVGETISQTIYWASAFATAVEMLSTRDDALIDKGPDIVGDRFTGQVFVVTGFTAKSSPEAKEVLDTITSEGGTWTTSWSGKAAGLIAGGKSLESGSSKITKAEKAGIPVYDVDDFLSEA